MKSIVKKLCLLCLAFLLVIGVGVFMALNTLVHKGIETIGSDITKTDIHVDGVRIMLLSGHAWMSGLVIVNPKGYSAPYALRCGKITIDFDPQSMFSDVLIVKQIIIEEPEVMYEASMKGSNINALSRTIDSYGRDDGSHKTSKEKEKQESAVIERLLIKKGKIHINAGPVAGTGLTVALSKIEMKDIGKGGKGVQISDIVMRVFGTLSGTVLTAVSSGSPLIQDASRTVGNVLSQGVKTGGDSMEKLGEAGRESVEKVFGGIKDILGGNK